jgi:hypothetical protein
VTALAARGGAAERTPADDSEATIERILELRREIDRLLAELSPEAQVELERRSREPLPGAGAPPAEPAAPAAPVLPSAPDTVGPITGSPAPQPTGPRCGTLEILDTNEDGVISGTDRNWRYLSLWRDDGDGLVEKPEVESLFEHGIRRVSARLLSYVTAKDVEGGVWVEDAIYFDLPGRQGRAKLVIDAGGLARGDRLWLEDDAGERLVGVLALTSGMTWVAAGGDPVAVLCR